jgi:hypothetical protein
LKLRVWDGRNVSTLPRTVAPRPQSFTLSCYTLHQNGAVLSQPEGNLKTGEALTKIFSNRQRMLCESRVSLPDGALTNLANCFCRMTHRASFQLCGVPDRLSFFRGFLTGEDHDSQFTETFASTKQRHEPFFNVALCRMFGAKSAAVCGSDRWCGKQQRTSSMGKYGRNISKTC